MNVRNPRAADNIAISISVVTNKCRFCGNYVDMNSIPADQIIRVEDNNHGRKEYIEYGVCHQRACEEQYAEYKKKNGDIA